MKFLSILIVLTMMTGLCAAGVMAEATRIVPKIPTALQKYGEALTASTLRIGAASLARVHALLASQGTPLWAVKANGAARIAVRTSPSANLMRWPALAGVRGAVIDSMSIRQISPKGEVVRAIKQTDVPDLPPMNRAGYSQKMSVIRIRGHDSALHTPQTLNDS